MLKQLLSSGEILESACIVQQPLCIVSSTGGRAVKMKGRASLFIKQVVAAIVSLVKAKSMVVRKKTSAIKTRLMILKVLRNKKALLSSISHKIHALTSGHGKENNALPLPNAPPPPEDEAQITAPVQEGGEEEHEGGEADKDEEEEEEEEDDDDDDGYPDFRHSLFEEDDDGLGDCTGSVIDLVRNNRKDGTEFKLEDEIDHVADVFIRRFHKQMRLQQQQSFKRHREMLEISV